MTYKTIVVHVEASAHADEQITLAANLANKYDAHLIGAAMTGIAEQFYLAQAAAGVVDMYTVLDYLREQATGILAKFEATAKQIGVKSCEKRLVEDEAGVGLTLQARYSDLVVIGQIDPDISSPFLRSDFPEYVLMHSGRPVLIVPYTGHFDQAGKRVLIAWNASIEAMHAVTAAIGLLKHAEIVQVVVFDDGKYSDVHGEQPGADIALYLARHGIKVEVLQQSMPSDINIGDALLSHASDFNADLIVMGGYSHSRFREIVIGGVTRTILTSMTIPVLMSH